MSYNLRVLSDNPLAFWPSGTDDISGFDNQVSIVGSVDNTNLPLVIGAENSSKLSGTAAITYIDIDGIATKNFSDDQFSIECWVRVNTTSSLEIPIVGDSSNDIGIFYKKGNIVFSIGTESIEYTVPFLKKSLHIVGVYSKNKIILYIDGKIEAEKDLSGFSFSNQSITMKSGPVNNSLDYMLLNCVSFYRNSLTKDQVLSHYLENKSLSPTQIVYPDQGNFFELTDKSISAKYSYSYPANKSWQYFINDNNLYYNSQKEFIGVVKGNGDSQSIVIEDFITIPSGPEMNSSRIEWDGDNGVSVSVSIDGQDYQSCVNGQPIPQYSLSSFSQTRNLYIRVYFTTSDDSVYLPSLKFLSISFYNNQKIYSKNSSNYIASQQDIPVSNNKYEILSTDNRNGISLKNLSSFYINTTTPTKSIEFFYTPYSIQNGGLVTSVATSGYSESSLTWSSNTISKSNISKIYVNGVDKTSQTNINNLFLKDSLHHVVIVFENSIYGEISINKSSVLGGQSLYQNLAIYESALSAEKVQDHFNKYVSSQGTIIEDQLGKMSELSVDYFNSDWIVVQNI
jgi:hypothetical protein